MTIEATVGGVTTVHGSRRARRGLQRGAPGTPSTTNVRAIILGGRRGERRLDAARSRPLALLEARDRSVLDWIDGALRASGISDRTYVGGYQIQKVMERYPELGYRFHARWQDEGEVAALGLGLADGTDDRIVLRGDTIVRPEAVERLLADPHGIVVGTRTAPSGGATLTGTIVIRSGRLAAVRSAVAAAVGADPSATLEALLDHLPDVARVDLTGLAAPIGEPATLLGTVFRGKARTLAGIASLCRGATVLDQVRFGSVDWATDPATVLAAVRTAFPTGTVVVRSSSAAEDGLAASAAGRFDSVLDVAVGDGNALRAAIDQVVESYRSGPRAPSATDEVLVQPQVRNLAASGVLFTRDLATGGPYFVVSLDRHSGRSDVVTSGADGQIETHYVSWAAADLPPAEPGIGRMIALARELIGLTYLDALDIELGVDMAGELYLFQVRPLVAATAQDRTVADDDLLAIVDGAHEFVAERLATRPGLPGASSILGNMPDWNPAEMIGAAPRPLALSLYQRLVGDRAWSRARARMGYRDVEPEPLILSVGGRPYVDVRASLASFLPAGLDEATASRWIDACVARLTAEPHLHDKVEFEVTPTCLAFDWPIHAERMRVAGLDPEATARFRAGLREVTARMLEGGDAAVLRELAGLDRLAELRAPSVECRPATAPGLARAVRDHVERCERYGVEPFAALARQAFVAMTLLRSLRDRGALTADELDTILRAIPTVASETARAIDACRAGSLSVKAFVAGYGHLRSNSYEITAPDYAASIDRILGDQGPVAGVVPGPTIEDAEAIFRRAAPTIERLLAEADLPGDANALFAFVRAAIAGRERAKFEFMRDLDLALETIAAFGAQVGLSRDDLAHLRLGEILLHATDSLTGATASRLRRSAGQNRKGHALTAALRLPDLIRTAGDVLAFRQEAWKPNFVTTVRVVAPVVALDEGPDDPALDGAIVLIRAADPGYDWIFSHRIAGLVTQYGGMGSHMAIRAAEFGLPAAIGCGEAIFEALRGAHAVELDCAAHRVRPVTGSSR